MTQTFLFTPRYEDGTRLRLQISAEDYAKVGKRNHGKEWAATVTDQITGRRYSVMAAECSLPGCYCDGLITNDVDPPIASEKSSDKASDVSEPVNSKSRSSE